MTTHSSTGRAPASRVSAVADKVEAGLNFLLALMLFVLAACLCYQVFGRYVLNHAPGWTEEVARILVVYITMLGTGVLVRRNGHIQVSVLIDAMPPSIRRWMLWFRDAVVLSAAGILAWFGYGLANIGANRLTPALEIPMFWPFLAVPASGVLIAFFLVVWRVEDGDKADDSATANVP